MTKNEAIRECKAMWAAIEKSGLTKEQFLEKNPSYLGQWWDDCPLCEYDEHAKGGCCSCPLNEQYHTFCSRLGFRLQSLSSPEWFQAVRNLKEDES